MMSTEFSSELRKSKNPFKIPKPQQLNYIATVQIPDIHMYIYCFMGVEITHIYKKEIQQCGMQNYVMNTKYVFFLDYFIWRVQYTC